MSFLKVKCRDCSNEQVIFERAASEVACNACGTVMLVPRGGRGDLKAELIEPVE